jgi:hypothetical protein
MALWAMEGDQQAVPGAPLPQGEGPGVRRRQRFQDWRVPEQRRQTPSPVRSGLGVGRRLPAVL